MKNTELLISVVANGYVLVISNKTDFGTGNKYVFNYMEDMLNFIEEVYEGIEEDKDANDQG